MAWAAGSCSAVAKMMVETLGEAFSIRYGSGSASSPNGPRLPSPCRRCSDAVPRCCSPRADRPGGSCRSRQRPPCGRHCCCRYLTVSYGNADDVAHQSLDHARKCQIPTNSASRCQRADEAGGLTALASLDATFDGNWSKPARCPKLSS